MEVIAELRVGAHDDKMGNIKAARKGRVSMHGCLAVCERGVRILSDRRQFETRMLLVALVMPVAVCRGASNRLTLTLTLTEGGDIDL